MKDGKLRAIVEAALDEAGKIKPNLYGEALRMLLRSDQALWDPNDWRTVQAVPEGLVFLPMHVDRGARSGTREVSPQGSARSDTAFPNRQHASCRSCSVTKRAHSRARNGSGSAACSRRPSGRRRFRREAAAFA